jgi:hypothetical protein
MLTKILDKYLQASHDTEPMHDTKLPEAPSTSLTKLLYQLVQAHYLDPISMVLFYFVVQIIQPCVGVQ